ncbi:uncharacterized protein [Pagrus major]|uniref:uncharacterized protein n=1 Tax=Pagrus major TaxID=143350 RepID=UPI003CC8E05D
MSWSLLIISLIGIAIVGGTDLCNTTCLIPNGTTSQSTVYTSEGTNFTSERAINGNMSECAHTLEQQSSWWTIDLLAVYNISSIKIYNTEHHNSDISDASIHIGNSRENNSIANNVCKCITNFIKNSCNDFQCNTSMLGRYITLSAPKHLVLCEVRICGTKQESPFELIKENKTWEDALSHCRDQNKDLASILDADSQAWAELEARAADTPFVWLALHYTCILEVWFWVDDHRLEFNRWAPENNTGDCDMSGAMQTREDHLWFSMSDYDKFNFICTK